MRIERAQVLGYRGPVAGARSSARTWTERQGLLLHLVANDGSVGQGEASPLPFYSRDRLDEARAALEAVDWERIPEYESGESAREWLGRVVPRVPRLRGSALFAVETALLDLLGQRLGQPLWTLLRNPKDTSDVVPLPLCALVGGADDPGAVPMAAEAVARGVHTVKVKISGPLLGSQLDVLAAVGNTLADTPLRLDANQTLVPGTAQHELSLLLRSCPRPELIEEPVPAAALHALGRLPVPIALDESLQEPDTWARLEPRLHEIDCVAVVLKPMALGGLIACLELAERATARGLDVTISHLFDGPVALAAAAHLALAVASRTRASGLDRHGGLGAWPSVDLPIVGPTTILVGERPGLGIAPVPAHSEQA